MESEPGNLSDEDRGAVHELVGPLSDSKATLVPTREQLWREDLFYLVTELPRRHKNLFFALEPTAFLRAVSRLDVLLGTLADAEIIVEFARLLALFQDAQTHVALRPGLGNFRAYPLRLAWFADGLYVVKTTAAYREALGKRLVGIGTYTIEQIFTLVSTLISHDNDIWLFSLSPHYIMLAEVLAALHVLPTAEAGRFVFTEADGRTFHLDLTPLPANATSDWLQASATVLLRDQHPTEPFWSSYLAASRALYFKYNACTHADTFRDFSRGLLHFIDRQPISCFIIDLRDNFGGNSLQFEPLLQGLRRKSNVNRRGRLFALIGSNTCGSALINAHQLLKRTSATLVGMPTGDNINRFAEGRTFRLPHSRLNINYPTKYIRLDEQHNGPLLPDVPVATFFDDYMARRDPVLEMALMMAGKV